MYDMLHQSNPIFLHKVLSKQKWQELLKTCYISVITNLHLSAAKIDIQIFVVYFFGTLKEMGSIFQEAYMGLDYVELPDLSLSALQKRFKISLELEELYKRYHQRFQVGEWHL